MDDLKKDPDGQRFLITRNPEEAIPAVQTVPLTVVLNWPSLLKK
jgi:hypothetical protein